MKLLYAGYRSWAFDAYRWFIFDRPKVDKHIVSTQQDLINELTTSHYDVVFLAGWSNLIPAEICDKHYIVAYHPSDLPNYAGGSPIQHQIMDGVIDTKATLFRVTSALDAGNVLMKNDISLDGNMSDIFVELSKSTLQMLIKLTDEWPNIQETKQTNVRARKRLKPDDSKLNIEKMTSMSAKQLYDFIRCHEDPYPNVFVEDETGKLLFKLVDFEAK